jgi:hypothetical protein
MTRAGRMDRTAKACKDKFDKIGPQWPPPGSTGNPKPPYGHAHAQTIQEKIAKFAEPTARSALFIYLPARACRQRAIQHAVDDGILPQDIGDCLFDGEAQAADCAIVAVIDPAACVDASLLAEGGGLREEKGEDKRAAAAAVAAAPAGVPSESPGVPVSPSRPSSAPARPASAANTSPSPVAFKRLKTESTAATARRTVASAITDMAVAYRAPASSPMDPGLVAFMRDAADREERYRRERDEREAKERSERAEREEKQRRADAESQRQFMLMFAAVMSGRPVPLAPGSAP